MISSLENLQRKLNNAYLFGWQVTKLRSLLSFALRRIKEGDLAQAASSLTFTTILALVPMLTVALAIFTVFPLFNTFRASLEAYFIQNLMPKAISSNILGYLTQFSSKATRLSAIGALALMLTSIATLATIERVFNAIWRVKEKRSWMIRVLVYWALITLAPLLIGVSLTVTSYLFEATSGVVNALPGHRLLMTLASLIFAGAAFGLLYFSVPNRRIAWRDAAVGGFVAGALFEIAKHFFAAFFITIPTYTFVYGTVAVVPLFLVWIYTSWLIILFGAVVTAALPVLKFERWWHVPKSGSRFVDAMAVLEVLIDARNRTTHSGISSWEIRQQTRIGLDEIESLLTQMTDAGWVGRLHKTAIAEDIPVVGSDWWVMLANPARIPISYVYRLFLFERKIHATDPTTMRLTEKVDAAIEQGLQESLEAYFSLK